MREIKLIVTVQVTDDVDGVSKHDAHCAAKEAIHNAVESASQSGFIHSLSHRISVGYVDTVVICSN